MKQQLKTEDGAILGYFENIAVKQDRLTCDGVDFPLAVIGNYTVTPFDETPPPPLDRDAAMAAIDAAVIAIYSRPMVLSKEYEQREAQAQAYKDADYTGAIPARVSAFATPAGLTFTAATDLILAQAATLRGALDQLSDLRMQKYAVKNAIDDAAAHAVFDAAMASIAQIGTALR